MSLPLMEMNDVHVVHHNFGAVIMRNIFSLLGSAVSAVSAFVSGAPSTQTSVSANDANCSGA